MPRVVSLLPSATELICLVGGAEMLVGRSHECDFPPELSDRPILTGAKNEFTSCAEMNDAVTATLSTGEGLYYIKGDLLQQLQPDVIVTQSLCNVCSVDLKLVEQLVTDMQQQLTDAAASTANNPSECDTGSAKKSAAAAAVVVPRIVSLNPFSIEDVLADATLVGQALGLQQQAGQAVAALQQRMLAAQQFVASQPPLKHPVVAFLEWIEPIFPGGHWTPQLIHMAGAKHPLNPPKGEGQGAGPSFAVYNKQLEQLNPDWIIICPCGLDIKETVQQLPPVTCSNWWKGLTAVQGGRVVMVDGNQHFNRPGPRLVDAFEFLVGLLHERHELIPQDFPWRFLDKDELLVPEAAWLEAHPDWQTRVQKGPAEKDGCSTDHNSCATGMCGQPAATPAVASPAI